MSEATHDTLVFRLAQILIKLNQGEKLDPPALAEEFGVNVRTIQRDLNVRMAYLPIENMGGRYSLDPAFLGKLTAKDIEKFAALAGVNGLFPSLSDDFLRDIFDSRMHDALLVKGHNYEDLSALGGQFRSLQKAILACRHVAFDYEKSGSAVRYDSVAPFKLVNNKGIWYLAGLDGDKLKTFAFSKISVVRVLETRFKREPDIDRLLESEEGVWLKQETQEIVIKVAAEVADYFRRRKLIANQVVEEVQSDGGLIISTKVGHVNQVLPIVKYWIPHLRIISPQGMQADLDAQLLDYVRVGTCTT